MGRNDSTGIIRRPPRNPGSARGVEGTPEWSALLSFLLAAVCLCQVATAQLPPAAERSAAQLVALARANRYQQDTTLAEYRALAKQRWTGSVGIAAADGLGPLGRMRLAARFETVARIGWNHRLGAWAELIASRGVAPIAGEMEPDPVTDEMAYAMPYHPGRDRLWPMDEMLDALEDSRDIWISHPLDAGSDSLYHFSLGGQQVITLPEGQRVRVRELVTRPVRPDHRLIVGSLWVDVDDGALVHAAYRPSVPVDLWPYMERNFDDGDRDMMKKLGPFRGNVEEIVVEHGLYAGRFWLPRTRIAHAEGTARGGRVTVSIEQTFTYERVSALEPGEPQAPQALRVDGRLSDSARIEREHFYYRYDSQRDRDDRLADCRLAGDSSRRDLPADSLVRYGGRRRWTQEGIPIRVIMPCTERELLTSPALPASIYSPSEELFTERDLARLQTEVRQALDLSAQAEWKPQAAIWRYGLHDGLIRYDRVEALSVGARVERELGKGYAFDGSARIGVADLVPNAEVGLVRRSGRAVLRGAAYQRLETVNDWGAPFGLSASLSALLFARDDWMYARTAGLEVRGTHARVSRGTTFAWRLFAEHERSAAVNTSFSLARGLIGTDFAPNIEAREGMYYGVAASMARSWGLDPLGAQFSGRLTLDAAGGERGFGRVATELRIAHGLGGSAVGALSAAAGTTVGDVPPQHLWYLGGAQTLHAHRVGALAGDAFWTSRAEVTKGFPLVRPVLFADWGWAGDRARLSRVGPAEQLWAAGVGVALLDGLVRFDVARALGERKGWSIDLFVEVR